MSSERVEKLITVKILGKEYRIRSDDENAVHRVAQYLDDVAERLQRESPVLNQYDLFVQTAFRAASDYFGILDQWEAYKKKVESDSDTLFGNIDKRLESIE